MTFGQALSEINNGKAMQRQLWNGKGMYIYLMRGSYDNTPEKQEATHIEGIPKELFNIGDIGTATRMPNFNMNSATGSTITGWLASQTDMLAHDWQEATN